MLTSGTTLRYQQQHKSSTFPVSVALDYNTVRSRRHLDTPRSSPTCHVVHTAAADNQHHEFNVISCTGHRTLLTKPAELATRTSLHIALLEVPHAKTDAYRAPSLRSTAPLPVVRNSLAVDHLSCSSSPSIITRVTAVAMSSTALRLWSTSAASSATTTTTARLTLTALPPAFSLERSIALHRGPSLPPLLAKHEIWPTAVS